MREEFEKLPEIASRLSALKFYEGHNFYGVLDESPQSAMNCNYVNGAWFACQEQQKKIDEVKSKVQDILTELDDRQSKEYIIEKCEEIIKEILK